MAMIGRNVVATLDAVVVGAGLFGSAAAKYISSSGLKVAVIGACETSKAGKATVFSSHYDEGRVQHQVDVDPTWTALNMHSVAQYDNLEKGSGVKFHTKSGCLYVSLYESDLYLDKLHENAAAIGMPAQVANVERLRTDYDFFKFPDNARGYLEEEMAGHINPRKLIEAQLRTMEKSGGVRVSDTVVGLLRHDSGMWHVHTESNRVFATKNVLLAPGAFANFNNLLPGELDLTLKGETVLLVGVSPAEAQRLRRMPSLLYEFETSEVEGVYMTPPIQYPALGGKWFLKMGCNLASDGFFSSLPEVQNWFTGGNSDANMEILAHTLHSFMPNLKTQQYITKRCILTRTPNRRQYIGKVDDHRGLFVATGGNGYSAMCSDAIGRIAAYALLNDGQVPAPFSADHFKPLWK